MLCRDRTPAACAHSLDQPEEERFGNIIGVVGRCHFVWALCGQFREPVPAQPPGCHLCAFTRTCGACFHIHAADFARNVVRFAIGQYQITIGFALFAAKAVVHVRDMARMTQRSQDMQQHHAVHAAAHGHPKWFVRLCELLFSDGGAYAIKHGARLRSRNALSLGTLRIHFPHRTAR